MDTQIALDGLERIHCRCDYEQYSDPVSGWTLRKCIEEGGAQRRFTAQGILGTAFPTFDRRLELILYGEWRSNDKYGEQFHVSCYELARPRGEAGAIAFLGSLKCKIGPKKAKAIYARFGSQTWDIIRNEPYRLTEVKGITETTVTAMLAKIEQNEALVHLSRMFCGNGNADAALTSAQLIALTKNWKDPAKVLREDPYLAVGVAGISFRAIDALMEGKIDPSDQRRLSACLLDALDRSAAHGHVCYPRGQIPGDAHGKGGSIGLIAEVAQLLHVPQQDVAKAAAHALKTGRLISTNGFFYTPERYEQEVDIARELTRLQCCEAPEIMAIDPFIQEYEEQNFRLAQQQVNAVRTVFRNQVTLITGGPGTGKSTVTKALIYVHSQVFGASSSPLLLAPTGKAAQRISEINDMPAQTIHSAVGYRGEDCALSNENEMLEENLIIVDEASMCDQAITAALTKKIKSGSKLVMVGDPDQLPSVGCGNVLEDMISSGAIPTVHLDVIYRQAGDDPIIANAKKIRDGESTGLSFTRTFKLLETHDNAETFTSACNMYLRSVKAYGIDQVLLLCPQRHNTSVSVGAINKALQEQLHRYPELLPYREKPGAMTMRVGSVTYRIGDKVMCLKNTAKARNGDVGYISDIYRRPDPDDMEQWLYYVQVDILGHDIIFDAEEMRDVELAFCSTVHKAQGSEYETVITIVSREHPTMLRRQVVYTAVTRAKKNLAIIGERAALDKAIRNGTADRRYTLLALRLRALLKERNK